MTESPYEVGKADMPIPGTPPSPTLKITVNFWMGAGFLCLSAAGMGFAIYSMFSQFMDLATNPAPTIKPAVLAKLFTRSMYIGVVAGSFFIPGLALVVRAFLNLIRQTVDSVNGQSQ